MANEALKCPLCKKFLTRAEYDKVMNIETERKKAMAQLKGELDKQREEIAKERRKLAEQKKGLAEEKRQAVLEAKKKAGELAAGKEARLKARLDKQFKSKEETSRKKIEKAQAEAREMRASAANAKREKSQAVIAATRKTKQAAAAKEAQLKAKLEVQHKAKEGASRRKAEKNAADLQKLRGSVDDKIAKATKAQADRDERKKKVEMNQLSREVRKEARDKEKSRIGRLTQSISKRDLKIRELDQQVHQLKNQMEKGTTPQIEGLLYEDVLTKELKKLFPDDDITHTGKGGDILHEVRLEEQTAGLIVYECKKVAAFKAAHIEQALKAKQDRKADFAVLVTNARKKGTSGFFVAQDVVIVDPAGVLDLAALLRESMVSMARIKATRKTKEELLKKMLEYLESPEYGNQMKDTIKRTKDLYSDLTKEVKSHITNWKSRYLNYQAIFFNVSKVAGSFERIMEGKALGTVEKPKALAPGEGYPPEPDVLKDQDG